MTQIDMTTTGLVVFVGILSLAIYDLFKVIKKGTGSTVSQFLVTTAFRSPVVSFGFGATVSHLFFYVYKEGCASGQLERVSYGLAGAGVALGANEIVRALKKK